MGTCGASLLKGPGQHLLRVLLSITFNHLPRIDAETGQWNGLISNQVRGEVDIGTAALTMCCKRTDAVDYLWPTSVTRESFAIKGW